MNEIKKIYTILLKRYSFQGWWPIKGIYHKKDYSYPKNKRQIFEIICGAILTQNTSWKQVEIALKNLRKITSLDPKKILNSDIKEAIRPAGYYNQKSERLKTISKWFIEKINTPTRDELLSIKGIGPETADSILLYAFKEPVFVVDAYTKRIFTRLGFISKNLKYNQIQEIFHNNLKKDFKLFNEYHALIVEHAKQFCKTKPECENCPLKSLCKFNHQIL